MAKYTELLAEYLQSGGQLPAAFDTIDGFSDLFIGHFCDREIGFETPKLFEIKLETRANLVIPIYKERIDQLMQFDTMFNEPTKTSTRSGNEETTRSGNEETTRSGNEETTRSGNEETTRSGNEDTEYAGSETNTRSGAINTNHGAQKETTIEQPFVSSQDITSENPSNIVDRAQYTDTQEYNSLTDTKNYTGRKDTHNYNDVKDTHNYNDVKDTHNYNDVKDTHNYNDVKDTHNYNDVKDTHNYNDVKDVISGFTPDEALAHHRELQEKVYIIKRELLNEFDSLFMVIYG